MVVRNFHLQLNHIKGELLKMAERVEEVLYELTQGFTTKDNAELMDKIIDNDVKINQIELDLHDQVTLLISKQQPVATDLRLLIVILKISSDLERIADLAVDMAKQTKRLKDEYFIEQKKNELASIFILAQEMIRKSLESFEQSDMLAAQKIAAMDDKVDHLYGEFIRNLFQMEKNQVEVDQVTQLAFIGRYIERMADYATNIAEWVVYEVNGQHFDLN